MSDPLAPFRKRPPTGGAQPGRTAAAPHDDRADYKAFDSKDRVERLRIHRRADQSRSPSYALLMDITYDDYWGTEFVLVWDFMLVLVTGNNLQEVVKSIQLGTAVFIQEFDQDRWDKPSDPNAPFIDSIEVIPAQHLPDGKTEKKR